MLKKMGQPLGNKSLMASLQKELLRESDLWNPLSYKMTPTGTVSTIQSVPCLQTFKPAQAKLVQLLGHINRTRCKTRLAAHKLLALYPWCAAYTHVQFM